MRFRRVTPLILPVLAAVPAISSCGTDSTASSSGHTTRDSAGTTIVENHSPAWEEGQAWSVSEAPVVRIGAAEGPEEYRLYRVVDALRLGNGSLVVANSGSGELRWFNRAGDYVTGIGRTGDGPAEFRYLSWIGRAGGDSVYAWDFDQRRLSVFVAGRLVRDVHVDIPGDRAQFRGLRALGVLAGGAILFRADAAYIPEDESGLQRPPVPLWRVSRTGEPIDSLGPFPGRFVNLQPAGGGWSRTEVPFGPGSLFAVAGERLAVADNAAAEIRLYAPAGAVHTIVRIDRSPRSVQPEDVDAELERRLSSVPPVDWIREGVRASFAEVPVPETMPYFQSLVADAEGNLWVRRYAPPQDTTATWDVFDSAGRWLGPVATPTGLRITDIGSDYLVGVSVDDLGIERVEVYELIKP